MTVTYVVILAGLSGAVVGSFVNVVATRVPEGRSILRPGSRCPNCLGPVRPLDNVPVLSYALLKGRCRRCGGRIPARYPATEIASSAAFVVVVWRLGVQLARPASALLGLVASAVFLAVAVTDLETRRIPRSIVYWALVIVVPVGALVAAGEGRFSAVGAGLGGAVGLGVFLLLIHELNPRWMGFGDVRYGFFLGWVLGLFGWTAILVGLMLALSFGSVTGLALIAMGKSKFGRALPFGPFLSAGAFVGMLWGPEIASWYLRLLGGALGTS